MSEQQPAVYTTSSEPQSSIEISISTKGVYTWTVKVYGHDPDAAYEQARQLSDQLEHDYGRPQT